MSALLVPFAITYLAGVFTPFLAVLAVLAYDRAQARRRRAAVEEEG